MKYTLGPRQLEYARVEATDFGARSIRHDAGHYVGICGEIAFAALLRERGAPFNYVAPEAKTWDFEAAGLRIDIKTQLANVPPSRDWYATILGFQAQHECDQYVFQVMVGDTIYVMSTYPKMLFMNHPRTEHKRQGEAHAAMPNGVQADCFMLRHQYMPEPDMFLAYLSAKQKKC